MSSHKEDTTVFSKTVSTVGCTSYGGLKHSQLDHSFLSFPLHANEKSHCAGDKFYNLYRFLIYVDSRVWKLLQLHIPSNS